MREILRKTHKIGYERVPQPRSICHRVPEFAEPPTHLVFSRLSSSPGVLVNEKKKK